ncbi:MAG: prepilin-type N-terminal cleavage/methylation domain-containing protein [Firmicutes bacterium]|nr:prepilin-type N-terminal cleavage/methylation domain-containing protein [Bacillota bacterium]
MLRNSRGITLISLVVTIIILLILSGAVITSIQYKPDVGNFNKMRSDITTLRDRVLNYYNEYGIAPIGDNVADPDMPSSQKNPNDLPGSYYKLDVSKLANITLNYGRGKTANDVYIINTKTLQVYYLKGIAFKGDIYYTIDSASSD